MVAAEISLSSSIVKSTRIFSAVRAKVFITRNVKRLVSNRKALITDPLQFVDSRDYVHYILDGNVCTLSSSAWEF